MVRQFAELGVSVAEEELDSEDVVEIWDIDAPAFHAFQAMDTQWRLVPIGGLAGGLVRAGLDYAGAAVVMQKRGLPDADFELIQAMEEGALTAYREVSN